MTSVLVNGLSVPYTFNAAIGVLDIKPGSQPVCAIVGVLEVSCLLGSACGQRSGGWSASVPFDMQVMCCGHFSVLFAG